MDTGSHHTAFPCAGCKNCGTHTDPYYEPKKSSTNRVLKCAECRSGAKCGGDSKTQCSFSQSYTEGSSWKAYQMEDLMYVGGLLEPSEPARSSGMGLQTMFTFGCQYSETGLFRTQKADGIMGMSANSMTIVPTAKAAHKIESKTFSMCFMKGGGMMMLGGADPTIQAAPMIFVSTSLSLARSASLCPAYVCVWALADSPVQVLWVVHGPPAGHSHGSHSQGRRRHAGKSVPRGVDGPQRKHVEHGEGRHR